MGRSVRRGIDVLGHNAIGLLALFVALGGGAYAATRSTFAGSNGVIKGCVQKGGSLVVVKPAKNCPRGTIPLPFSATGRRGLQGLQGTPGVPGTPGAPGSPGAAGTARAYGLVNRFLTGAFISPGSKNVVAVTNPFTGEYCIQLASSIDATTAVLLTTPDYEHSDVFAGAIATYVYPDGAGCTVSNSMAVITGYYGISAGPPATPAFTSANESFTFAVP